VAAEDCLEILSPGPLTTVQDLGRFGYGRFGVPRSGALDAFALRIGNLLVGNREGEAGLEITLPGFKAGALTDLVIAVTGGDLRPRQNNADLALWSACVLRRGDMLSFRGLASGCRAYLALGGGIEVPPVMGSKSTNLITAFGGLQGRALQKGDILASDSPAAHIRKAGRSAAPETHPVYGGEWTLRVIPGPQDDHFAIEARERFFAATFRVKPESDRVGIRLTGPPIRPIPGMPESIISEGVFPGTIQLPGDGQPIIILNETVTGGYRKIATVISADRSLLGQMKPGDRVAFKEVRLGDAYKALRKVEGLISRIGKAER
jgi:antagonist of KipI